MGVIPKLHGHMPMTRKANIVDAAGAFTLSPWAPLLCPPACLPTDQNCIPLPGGVLLAAQVVVLKCQETNGLWRQSSSHPWQVNKYALTCLLGGGTMEHMFTIVSQNSPMWLSSRCPQWLTGLIIFAFGLLLVFSSLHFPPSPRPSK